MKMGAVATAELLPFLARCWAPWQKCCSKVKGHLMAQKQGGRGDRKGRASICAQQRLQRQQILAERGACTEEKEMEKRPNTQFGIKKPQEHSVAYGERK